MGVSFLHGEGVPDIDLPFFFNPSWIVDDLDRLGPLAHPRSTQVEEAAAHLHHSASCRRGTLDRHGSELGGHDAFLGEGYFESGASEQLRERLFDSQPGRPGALSTGGRGPL